MEADNLLTPIMTAWAMVPRWKTHELVYDVVGEVNNQEARFGEIYQIDFVAGLAHTAQGPVILKRRFPTPRQGQISG
jgi:hypothetical protein